MSLSLRIIPCLDVAGGRVVKGVNFRDLQDSGDPIELASKYATDGADELTFLDISATIEQRSTLLKLVTETAEQVFIPLTVGGGIGSVENVTQLLGSGADKVSVNSAALARPSLIDDISQKFGSQVLVISLDVRRSDSCVSGFTVTSHGGQKDLKRDALDWVKEAIDRGVGEILMNSIDADGTKQGFDLELIRAIRSVSSVPIIASGGAGALEHFLPAIVAGADAVLAASVFHNNVIGIAQLKQHLLTEGVEVRL